MATTLPPAANLLDEYLQATSTGAEQAVRCPVPAETMFLHAQVLQGVHGALDSALAARGVNPSSPRPWSQQQQVGGTTSSSAAAAWSPDRAASVKAASTSAATPRGLFRAMRHADASALYAEQLAAEHTQPGTVSRQHHMQQMDAQQQPLFAGTDGLTSEVRLLADHAALSTKLQKLQQDMDVRSYRQSLLRKLQQPSNLFSNQPQEQLTLPQQQQQRHQQHAAGASTLLPGCSSAVMWHPSDSLMGPPEPRPCTAPKPSVSRQGPGGCTRSAGPAAAEYGTAASAHSSGSRSQRSDELPQAAATAAGCDAGAGGWLAATAPPQLQHLKLLAELELPWKPPAATSGINPRGATMGAQRSGHNTWPAHQRQPRATSPCSSSISSGSGASAQRLFAQPEQQQQQQVQRPSSAVAALQQSLSELAKLKAKFGQQQQQRGAAQQQQLRAQQEQRWQQEQQQRSQEQQERELRRDVAWLTARAAAGVRHHTHTLHAAAPAAAAETWGHDREGDASRASAWADQDTDGLGLAAHNQQRQQPCSNSHSAMIQGSYSRWDAWQQQVHGHRQAQQHLAAASRNLAAGAAAAASAPSSGASLKQQQALRRSQSVPRLRRAWDDLPLDAHLAHSRQQQQQQRAGAEDAVLGRRSSSPGGGLQDVMGLLRSSWQDGTALQQRQRQQQLGELHRPKTAGARVEGSGWLHAATAAGRGAGLGSTATRSGWLDSSPVKRAARLAALSGSGNTAATAGAGKFLPTERAGAAGTTAGSSWLPGGAGSSGARWGQQQVAGCSSSMPTRLHSAAGVSGVLGASGQQQHSWLLPQSAAQQAAPMGACKAAVLASRARAAASAGARTAAAAGSAAARRQELVQRALSGYKPQQVSKRSTLYDDASSVTSDDSSRPGSFGPAAAAAAAAGGQRQSAYAAALARLQAAKRGAGRPCSSQGRGRGCDDDASSSSSTDAGDDDSCVMGV